MTRDKLIERINTVFVIDLCKGRQKAKTFDIKFSVILPIVCSPCCEFVFVILGILKTNTFCPFPCDNDCYLGIRIKE